MSVLIKGMEMPTMPKTFKQAEKVPYIDVRIFADGTAVTSKRERPYYTQYIAIPVPPHGRLIDADEVMERIAHDTPLSSTYERVTRRYIDTSPTIIEEEVQG